MKKIVALGLVAVLTLALVGTAFAGSVAKTVDPSVTVTGLDAGDVVKFYQVVEWNQSSGWVLKAPFTALDAGVAGYQTGDKGYNTSGDVLGYNTSAGDVAAIQKDVLKYISGIPATVTGVYEGGILTHATTTEGVRGRVNSELAAAIAAIVSGNTANLAYSETVASGASSVTWDSSDGAAPAAGLYVALVTPKTAGTVYNPIFVSADYESANSTNSQVAALTDSYSDTAMAKKKTIDVKKTVSDSDGNIAEGTTGEGVTAATADIGEVLDFTVRTTIPEYSDLYTSAQFIITDTLTGLELVETDSNFTVTVGGSDPITTIPTAYTETAADGNTSYTVTFDSDYILGLDAAQEVVITYKAKVVGTATQVVNPTDNTVKVEFSNNPNKLDDKGTLKDRTNHYSFSIDATINGHGSDTSSELIKVGVSEDGTAITSEIVLENNVYDIPALPDATFVLLTSTTGADAYIGMGKSALETEAAKVGTTIYKNDVHPNGAIIETDSRGKMNFKGLDVGTYYLMETKAPDGFIRDTKIYTITISATFTEVTTTEEIAGITVTYKAKVLDEYTIAVSDGSTTTTSTYKAGYNGAASENMVFSNVTAHSEDNRSDRTTLFVNSKGTELPSTGGIGTTIFYVTGLIMVLGAGAILVARRKADAE